MIINNLTNITKDHVECVTRDNRYKYERCPEVTKYSVVDVIRGTKVSHSQLQIGYHMINQ